MQGDHCLARCLQTRDFKACRVLVSAGQVSLLFFAFRQTCRDDKAPFGFSSRASTSFTPPVSYSVPSPFYLAHLHASTHEVNILWRQYQLQTHLFIPLPLEIFLTLSQDERHFKFETWTSEKRVYMLARSKQRRVDTTSTSTYLGGRSKSIFGLSTVFLLCLQVSFDVSTSHRRYLCEERLGNVGAGRQEMWRWRWRWNIWCVIYFIV